MGPPTSAIGAGESRRASRFDRTRHHTFEAAAASASSPTSTLLRGEIGRPDDPVLEPSRAAGRTCADSAHASPRTESRSATSTPQALAAPRVRRARAPEAVPDRDKVGGTNTPTTRLRQMAVFPARQSDQRGDLRVDGAVSRPWGAAQADRTVFARPVLPQRHRPRGALKSDSPRNSTFILRELLTLLPARRRSCPRGEARLTGSTCATRVGAHYRRPVRRRAQRSSVLRASSSLRLVPRPPGHAVPATVWTAPADPVRETISSRARPRLGDPNRARVGVANGRNTISIVIPHA